MPVSPACYFIVGRGGSCVKGRKEKKEKENGDWPITAFSLTAAAGHTECKERESRTAVILGGADQEAHTRGEKARV